LLDGTYIVGARGSFGLVWQFARHWSVKLGYHALGVDYDDDPTAVAVAEADRML
jgi:hypothetical protein